jgi:peptidoglycan/xylan/chitin deacetylase (PgdA/CDA1 family)
MLRHPAYRDPARALFLGLLAQGMHLTGLSRAALSVLKARHRPGYIRVINYHGTAARHADSLRRQLAFYKDHFVPVGREALDELLARGHWRHRRPGLLISFDDGLRNNYDVAAPILEEYGFTGWFFVPTEFISLPPAQQAGFAGQHRINALDNAYPDGRVAMNWDEVRSLDCRHVVGCHTRHHVALAGTLSLAELTDEITRSKQRLEAELGHAMPYFCWVGGEESSYSAAAAREIRQAGYRYSFMTNCAPVVPGTPALQIHRTNVEASWPLRLVSFQLSGVMDVLYTAKRRRVNALTAAAP